MKNGIDFFFGQNFWQRPADVGVDEEKVTVFQEVVNVTFLAGQKIVEADNFVTVL
jgi:hypothetical protein